MPRRTPIITANRPHVSDTKRNKSLSMQSSSIADGVEIRVKSTAALKGLTQWSRIDEVNEMIDNGHTPEDISKWCTLQGHRISERTIQRYIDLRQQALANSVTEQRLMTTMGDAVSMDMNSEGTQRSEGQLRSDLDALDLLIQGGFDTVRRMISNGEDINPRLMLDAIRLKHELSDGNTGTLTNHGIEELRNTETRKYAMLIQYLVTHFVPADEQDEVLCHMDELEDAYYQGTPYYVEYLRAKGATPIEIEAQVERVGYSLVAVEDMRNTE